MTADLAHAARDRGIRALPRSRSRTYSASSAPSWSPPRRSARSRAWPSCYGGVCDLATDMNSGGWRHVRQSPIRRRSSSCRGSLRSDGSWRTLLARRRACRTGRRAMCFKRVIKQAAEARFEMKSGVECEFFLITPDGAAIADPNDRQAKACYDQQSLMRRYDVIAEVCDAMLALGWKPYQSDHEDAHGQFEMNWEYDNALVTADRHAFFKFMLKSVAEKHGLRATFMPKPFPNVVPSGCHAHVSHGGMGTQPVPEHSPATRGCPRSAYQFLGEILETRPVLRRPDQSRPSIPTSASTRRVLPTGAPLGPAANAITYGGDNRTHLVAHSGRGGASRSRSGTAPPIPICCRPPSSPRGSTGSRPRPIKARASTSNMCLEEGRSLTDHPPPTVEHAGRHPGAGRGAAVLRKSQASVRCLRRRLREAEDLRSGTPTAPPSRTGNAPRRWLLSAAVADSAEPEVATPCWAVMLTLTTRSTAAGTGRSARRPSGRCQAS